MSRAYAVLMVSREWWAEPEGERMVKDRLREEVSTLGSIIPLSEQFTVDPFEEHGDWDSPMSTDTTAVVKLACDIIPKPLAPMVTP